MEDPETPWTSPGTLCLPWAAFFLLYSLVMVISYILDVASLRWLARAERSRSGASLSTAWFGHQVLADAVLTGLLPLSFIWTRPCWPLGCTFCHLDPSLAFFTFWASGRLLTRVAADRCTLLLQPTWAQAHKTARRMVFWAGGFWILLLGLTGRALGAARDRASQSDSLNCTATTKSLISGQDTWAWSPALDQLAFGFGVPLGVLCAVHSLVRVRLQLAGLTGRPPLLGLPWATVSMLFLSWFPFHLVLLLRLLGMRGAGLQLGHVWVLLRPLGLTLLGSSGCLHSLFHVCVDQAFRKCVDQAQWSCPGGGEEEEAEGTWL